MQSVHHTHPVRRIHTLHIALLVSAAQLLLMWPAAAVDQANPAGTTPAGMNGQHDMGGNAWEWVGEPAGVGPATATGAAERRTRGGSWWYGQAQMQADHLQSKPGNTTVVYVGFRCLREVVPAAVDFTAERFAAASPLHRYSD